MVRFINLVLFFFVMFVSRLLVSSSTIIGTLGKDRLKKEVLKMK